MSTIGIWILVIGIVVIIAALVLFYTTTILSTTWTWVVIGVGIALIIVGAIIFFFVGRKKPPVKKQPPPPPPPQFIPSPEPQFIPQQTGGVNTELLFLMQQNQEAQQERFRSLEKQLKQQKEDRRYEQLQKQILALSQRDQGPPQIVVPGKGVLNAIPMAQLPPSQLPPPQRVVRTPSTREQIITTGLNPSVVSTGIQTGGQAFTGGLQAAQGFAQIATNPHLIEAGNKFIAGLSKTGRVASALPK